MEKLVLIVHVLTALGIIALVLLQQGKGAEAGASFGSGASQTVFGSQGSGNFLSHLTAIMASIFFVTSFGLAVLASRNPGIDLDSGLPAIPGAVEQSTVPTPALEGEVPQQGSRPLSGELPSIDEVITGELPSVDEVPEAGNLPEAGSDQETDQQ